jgi:hypothetical protein
MDGERAFFRRSFLRYSRVLIVAAAAGGSLPACHSNEAGDGGVVGDVDFVTCDTETRAVTYQSVMPVRMQESSSAGTYVLKLISNTFTDSDGKTTDQAPAKGVDVWNVEIDRADSMAPVDGLTLTVVPYMPDHRHGTTPVGVMPVGSGGDYTINPLNLYMAGYWEITVSVLDPTADGGTTESVLVPICVPD